MGVAIVWAINKKNRTLVTLKTWTLNCILKLDTWLNTWSGGFEKHSPSHGTYISFYFPASLIIWQARITFQFSVSLNSWQIIDYDLSAISSLPARWIWFRRNLSFYQNSILRLCKLQMETLPSFVILQIKFTAVSWRNPMIQDPLLSKHLLEKRISGDRQSMITGSITFYTDIRCCVAGFTRFRYEYWKIYL